MIDRQAIIQAVAKKHGILLSEEDPVLSFLAVHDVILDDYQDRFERAENLHQERIEKLLDGYSDRITQVIQKARADDAGHPKADRPLDRNEKNAILKEKLPRKEPIVFVLWSVIVASSILSAGLLFYLYG